jgi:uncharacterized protein (DUF1778 family)
MDPAGYAQLTARIPQQTQRLLEKAAAWQGLTLDGFVMAAAVKEAEELLGRANAVSFNPQDSGKFTRMREESAVPAASGLAMPS